MAESAAEPGTTVADVVPAGAAAKRAWRELDPAVRKAAQVAAERGGAHPDPAVARVAAGYARTVIRDGRRAVFLVAAAFITGLVVVVLIDRLAPEAHTAWRIAALATMAVLVLGGGYALFANRGRLKMSQLHNANMLAIEREAHAADRTRANPREAGASEIRIKRTQALILIGLSTLITGGSLARVATGAGTGGIFDFLLPSFFLLMTAVFLFANLRMLINPVFARLTPDGWELPGWRVSGTWNQVKGIRVRADGPEARLVVVDLRGPKADPYQAPFDQRSQLRRALDQQGTPFVIQAHRKLNMPAADLVALLRRYTNAPVTWG